MKEEESFKGGKLLPACFIQEIKEIILTSRTNAIRSVDFCRVQMNWTQYRTLIQIDDSDKRKYG